MMAKCVINYEDIISEYNKSMSCWSYVFCCFVEIMNKTWDFVKEILKPYYEYLHQMIEYYCKVNKLWENQTIRLNLRKLEISITIINLIFSFFGKKNPSPFRHKIIKFSYRISVMKK